MANQNHAILDRIFHTPQNACTQEELEIQLKQCLASFDKFCNENGSILIQGLGPLCAEMGLPMETDEGEVF